MTGATPSRDIEDVLSAVRRLVAQMPEGRVQPAQPMDKLVLSSALRVDGHNGTADPAVGFAEIDPARVPELPSEPLPDHDDSLAPVPLSASRAVPRRERADDDPVNTLTGRLHFVPAREDETSAASPHEPALDTAPDDAQLPQPRDCVAPQSRSLLVRISRSALRYCAEIEAARRVATPKDPDAQAPVPDATPEPELPAPSGSALLQPQDAARPEPERMVEDAPASAASACPAGDDPRAPEVPFDEALLHDIVARIVRQELQGELGEKITRNIRKLVHSEVARELQLRKL